MTRCMMSRAICTSQASMGGVQPDQTRRTPLAGVQAWAEDVLLRRALFAALQIVRELARGCPVIGVHEREAAGAVQQHEGVGRIRSFP
eukprot:3934094-Rhodomonas_salina.10